MESLALTLDFRNKKKLCDQILAEMRSQVLLGKLQPGEQLPTVRELAAQLKVNFNTVARAYRTLDMEGLITTRQGRGTFVTSKEIQEPPDRQQMKDMSVSKILDLIQLEAQKTEVPADEIVRDLERKLIDQGLLVPQIGMHKPLRRKRYAGHKPGAHMAVIEHHTKRVSRKLGKLPGRKPGNF